MQIGIPYLPWHLLPSQIAVTVLASPIAAFSPSAALIGLPPTVSTKPAKTSYQVSNRPSIPGNSPELYANSILGSWTCSFAREAVLPEIATLGLHEVVNLGDHVTGPLEASRTAVEAVISPFLHQSPTFKQQVTSPVGTLNLTPNFMHQT